LRIEEATSERDLSPYCYECGYYVHVERVVESLTLLDDTYAPEDPCEFVPSDHSDPIESPE
jgi:hypothetical protein